MSEMMPEQGPPYEGGPPAPDAIPDTAEEIAYGNPFGPVSDAPPIVDTKPPRVPDHTASRDKMPGEGPAKKTTKVPTIPASKVEAQLVKPLTEIYQFVGGVIMLFDQYCALPWINGAEERARKVAEIAQRNDAVRKAILFLVESSDATQLAMIHAPLVMAPLMHHAPIGPKLTDEQIAAFLASSESTGDNES
jgi:hypothetical protein